MRLLYKFTLSPALKFNANGPRISLAKKEASFKRWFKTNFVSNRDHMYFGFEITSSGEK